MGTPTFVSPVHTSSLNSRLLYPVVYSSPLTSNRHLKSCSKLSSQLFSHPSSIHNLPHLQNAPSSNHSLPHLQNAKSIPTVPQAKAFESSLIPPFSRHSRSITKPGQLSFQNLSRINHFSPPPPWAKVP